MAKQSRNEAWLQRDGQSQTQRRIAALDPEFFRLDERNMEDLLRYAQRYAAELRYFDLQNEATGDWQGFLASTIGKTAAELDNMDAHEPHLALYLCFLHLFTHAQEQLNTLTQRHLAYYFEKVLQIKRRAPKADQVHLVFELAKNTAECLLKKDTLLLAGKDETGRPLHYAVTEDTVLNRAEIKHLRSQLYHNGKIHIAPVANSGDGVGEPFAGLPAAWPPFGSPQHPVASVGFAVASPVLKISGGDRTIRLLLNISSKSSEINTALLSISARITGAEGWIGPLPVAIEWKDDKENPVLELTVQTLGREAGAIFSFQQDLHGGNFNTREPLIQLLAEAATAEMLNKANITGVGIQVDVSKFMEFDNFELSSSGSVIADVKKAFEPFGTIFPKNDAYFHVDSEEIFSKPLQQITLHFDWNTKADNKLKADISVHSGTLKGKGPGGVLLFSADKKVIHIPEKAIPRISHKDYFAVTPFTKRAVSLRSSIGSGSFIFQRDKKNTTGSFPLIEGLVALQSYLATIPSRGLSIRLYGTGLDTPVKPVAGEFSITYRAATHSDLTERDDEQFNSRTIQFFHIGPFGQCERHSMLQKQGSHIPLLSLPEEEGALYVGLQNLAPRQSLNLLVQVLEGSAHPEKEVQKVTWSVLSGNNWLTLDGQHLLADRTNGFLTSGIVRLIIPSGATTDNTLLESGFIWLKAAVDQHPDAVCKLLDVRAQAVMAQFKNISNTTRHPGAPLESGRISKLAIQDTRVKKIHQPFSSFGGRSSEAEASYYTRVAERLRHKNRAVTIWDFERMVLEKFPEVFQVKCINHCSDKSESAPGNVTLVVIPDFRNYTADDPLRPRLPKNTLFEIGQFLKKHCPPNVRLFVRNPVFEQIAISCKAAFYKEFEFGLYKKQLETDIIRLLSPWVHSNSPGVRFDGRYYRSALIYELEQLPYVDFLTHFEMRLQIPGGGIPQTNEISASHSRAILVPAYEHDIQPIDK